MNHLGLFEGIGGFSLASRWMGWETKAWCEWNKFGQAVLKYYFPEAIGHGDITKTDFTPYANTIDILTGGFPCQPYSTAGKRLGKEDERHLWPEMLRAIREVSPRWVVGENVRGLVSWNGGLVFNEVQADLEAIGYEVLPFLLPACAVNAPHRRDRIWFVAHRNGTGLQAERPEQQAAGTKQYGELDGPTAHANNKGSSARPGQIQGPNGEIPQWNDHAEFSDTGIRDVSNTQRKGLEGGKWTQKSEGFKQGCKGVIGDAANTQGIGVERDRATREQKPGTPAREGVLRCDNSGTSWDEWPTQSPLCSRNDGLSTRLSGTAFLEWEQSIGKLTPSKHRAESIKAYGNAIVPQVAYQIFKAIEQYETNEAEWT